jgi:archaellum component FlaC
MVIFLSIVIEIGGFLISCKRGDMTRIRVDPDLLRDIAKDFKNTADDIVRGGDNIFSVAMSIPSYDGQLSNPAIKTGYEVQSTSKTLSGYYKHDSEILIEVANRNEAIDKQTVHEFDQSRKGIEDYINEIREGIKDIGEGIVDIVEGVSGIQQYIITYINVQIEVTIKEMSEQIIKTIQQKLDGHDRGGNALMGYDWNPFTHTLTIWRGKEVIVQQYNSKDNWPANVQRFVDNVDMLDTAKFTLFLGVLGAAITGLSAIGQQWIIAIPVGIISAVIIVASIGYVISSAIEAYSEFDAIKLDNAAASQGSNSPPNTNPSLIPGSASP